MADTMIRGMAANKQVRFFACNSTDTVEKARITHHTSPVVTNALGRLLTGGVLMGAMCKNDTDKLTLRIQCQGPISGMLVTADANGHVKGYVSEPEVMLPANDVAKAVDLGVLSVIICRRHPSGKRRDCRGSDLLFCNKRPDSKLCGSGRVVQRRYIRSECRRIYHPADAIC